MGQFISTERRDAVALVTIDNPPANTWTPEDLRALEKLVAELNADRAVYAAVITGAAELSVFMRISPVCS